MAPQLHFSAPVRAALAEDTPVVALESTVIAHGLPYPHNIKLARTMEAIVHENGATPATIAMIGGQIMVGLADDQLRGLGDGSQPVRKLSRRDLGSAQMRGEWGATTVAATMLIAHWAGISVFATGGIGGVHRGETGDVSADLIELSQTPVAVVCAGAKSILDLPRTLEWLETFGVPVVGYQTDTLPAFYTRTTGLELVERVESAAEAGALLRAHWGLGLRSGVLLTAPIPPAAAMQSVTIDTAITQALQEAAEQGISGKAVTPYILSRLAILTDGASVQANLALLQHNAQIAAQVAVAYARA